VFDPETLEAARETYETVGPAARTAVREATTAMGFDRDEYGDRVTGEVVETARDAVFASLLVVRIADRPEFDAWRADADVEVTVLGSPDVDRVVWHVAPAADAAVAATFQNEREAAVATLRRQAFARCYRDRL
jgi:hypothetical protein